MKSKCLVCSLAAVAVSGIATAQSIVEHPGSPVRANKIEREVHAFGVFSGIFSSVKARARDGMLLTEFHEVAHGAEDQNGDLDTSDPILAYRRLATGESGVLPFAVASLPRWTSSDETLLSLSEAKHGNADLNGDGDVGDEVLMHYDYRTQVAVNLAVDGHVMGLGTALGHGKAAIEVSESAQSQDLNGDGDQKDRVFHVLDLENPAPPMNLGRGIGGSSRSNGRFVGVELYEDQGVSLNGDSDTLDVVMHVYDLASGTLANLGLATPARGLTISGGMLYFYASEFGEGRDLNGDGDKLDDAVLHAHELASGTTTNLGLAVGSLVLGGDHAAFTVEEEKQGVDLNGNGRLGDEVLFTYDPWAGTVANLGYDVFEAPAGPLPSFLNLKVVGDVVAFTASEAVEKRDLDGDGALDDEVLFEHRFSTGVTRLVLSNPGGWELEDEILWGSPVEAVLGQDVNGDGDLDDTVLHVYDTAIAKGATLPLALPPVLSSALRHDADGGVIAFTVDEAAQGGADLNGDGDADDFVLHVGERSRRRVTNLGYAVEGIGGFSHKVKEGVVAFLVEEAAQGGTDLNGDGDTLDHVLHVYEERSGKVRNLRTAPVRTTNAPVVFVRGRILALVDEEGGVPEDMNGDGDTQDLAYVLHRRVF